MGDEIDIGLGSFDFEDATNGIAISDFSIAVAKAVQEFGLVKFHGAVIPIEKRKSLTVRMRGTVRGTGYDNLRGKLDSLKNALESSSEQSLTIDDDRILKVQYRNFSCSFTTIRTIAEFSVELIASDPFWYASSVTENDKNTYSAPYTVNNPGNAATRAKVTISRASGTIADECKLENTTTGEIFQYRGTVAAGDDLVVNNMVDATDEEVTNDGVADIANFEGDFITLNPGDNSFTFTGPAAVRIKIAYRPAYY